MSVGFTTAIRPADNWVGPPGRNWDSNGNPIYQDFTTSLTTETITFTIGVIEAMQSTPSYLAATTTSTFTGATSELPKSIVPSDLIGSSFTGSSMPTTLVIDTSSPEAPLSTEWVVSPTSAESESIQASTSAMTRTEGTASLSSKTATTSTSRAGAPFAASSDVSESSASSRGAGLTKVSVGILGFCLAAIVA